MGWPLRSVSPVSAARGARPVNERNRLAVANRLAGPMVATSAGAADLGQAGQAAGQRCRVDLLVGGLPGGGVGGQLGLGGLGGMQQADLGSDLGGQVAPGDGGVVAVQVHRGSGSGQPLLRPCRAVLAAGGGADALCQAGVPGAQQRVRVRPALQHGQVGAAEVADQGAGRQQLAGEVLDPAFVLGGLLGEPVAGAHPPVQGRPGPGAGQGDRVVGGAEQEFLRALTPDGRLAVSSSSSSLPGMAPGTLASTIKVWDLDRERSPRTVVHGGGVSRLAITPDGRWLVTDAFDGTFTLWDLDTGATVASFTADGAGTAVAVAAGDGLLAVCGDVTGAVHFLRLEGHSVRG